MEPKKKKSSTITGIFERITYNRMVSRMFQDCVLCYQQRHVDALRAIIVGSLGHMYACSDCLCHIHNNCAEEEGDCRKCGHEEFRGWKIPEDDSIIYVPSSLWLEEHQKRLTMVYDTNQTQLNKVCAQIAPITAYLCLKELGIFPKDLVRLIAKYVYSSYIK